MYLPESYPGPTIQSRSAASRAEKDLVSLRRTQTGILLQPTTSSHGQDGGAYCGAAVGGKCMVSTAKLVVFAFAVQWYVWFWSTAKFGDSWKRAHLPPKPPPKVGEVLLFYFSQTASRGFLSLSLMKSASTFPTIRGGRVGEGCSFSVVPKFRRRPNPTIPLHSKFINDQLCL